MQLAVSAHSLSIKDQVQIYICRPMYAFSVNYTPLS